MLPLAVQYNTHSLTHPNQLYWWLCSWLAGVLGECEMVVPVAVLLVVVVVVVVPKEV